jgi:catechol 2,3-dioxygenase-like lactoylglutathione lyase family enzyme
MAKAGFSTPTYHVADIEKSIWFYELLGFVTIDTDGEKPLGWARMQCEGGALMFLRAEGPVDASAQPALLYMYTPDLPALRDQLISKGIKVAPIAYPGYMPSGEICVCDPDGYMVLVGHWGEAEQAAWEKRIGGTAEEIWRKASGDGVH